MSGLLRQGDVHCWYPDGVVALVSPGDGFYFQACVHPAGDHVVFWGAAGGPPRLWRADLGGGNPAPASPFGPPGARHPAYGAAGDRLVCAVEPAAGETVEATFATTATGAPRPGTTLRIWTMAPDGTDPRPLTDDGHQDQRPCLSADGTTVVFVTDRSPAGLWTVPVTGGTPRPLRPEGVRGYRPWFSLDGRTLYFFTLGTTRRQIHALPLDDPTGPPVPLANDDRGRTHGPFADPTGDRLLVHSDRDGRWSLHELPLDGSPMRPLTPPGFADVPCGHPTRSRDHLTCFDAGATTLS